MIDNRNFRRALLCLNGLAAPGHIDPLPSPDAATGVDWVHAMVLRLGFVQVDPICVVERAHRQILFSRNRHFEQAQLDQLLERDRRLFENWTHDAAILPVESYPYWKHYFERAANHTAHPGYRRYFAPLRPADTALILRRIERDGPLRPKDIEMRTVKYKDDYFARPSLAKIGMEYLWRTGKLAVCRRESQQKVYDLSERVIPAEHYAAQVSRSEYVAWCCREALKRLGAGTATQIARFFDAISREEAQAWCEKRLGKELATVRVKLADRSPSAPLFALEDVVAALDELPAPPRRPRLLSPFDPLIHDRKRTQQVFGFDYTVEIWVPAKKRRYGYYALPILEGERFTGRVDAKIDRKRRRLDVLGLWWEPRIQATERRTAALRRELGRLARFAGAEDVRFVTGRDDKR